MFDAEVAGVDAFIAEYKTLDGFFPGWSRSYGRDYTARWGVIDALNIRRGELVFSVDRDLIKPTIVVLMDRRLIHRTDIVPDGVVETNPLWAAELMLPSTVNGSHVHPWWANKEWVRENGFGPQCLQVRAPFPRGIDTLEQGLAVTAEAVNITINPDQRDCRLPTRSELF